MHNQSKYSNIGNINKCTFRRLALFFFKDIDSFYHIDFSWYSTIIKVIKKTFRFILNLLSVVTFFYVSL